MDEDKELEAFFEWEGQNSPTPREAWLARAALATTEATDAIAPTEGVLTLTDEQIDFIQGCGNAFSYDEIRIRMNAATPSPEAPAVDAVNEWKLAVDNELVTIGSTADTFESPRAALNALIDWHVAVALDSAISGTGDDSDAARVAQGLEACDWSGIPIGNKAIIQHAITLLRAALSTPSPKPAVDALTTGAVAGKQNPAGTAKRVERRGYVHYELIRHSDEIQHDTPLYTAHSASEPKALTLTDAHMDTIRRLSSTYTNDEIRALLAARRSEHDAKS